MKIVPKILLLLLLAFPLFAEDAPAPTPPPAFPGEKLEEPNLSDDRFFFNLMQMLTTLGLIIALLFFVSYFLRKLLSSRTQQLNVSSDIKILESRAISSKATIHLLEVQGKQITIAESHTGVTLLSTSDVPTETE